MRSVKGVRWISATIRMTTGQATSRDELDDAHAENQNLAGQPSIR
jgi:hypothetical protein